MDKNVSELTAKWWRKRLENPTHSNGCDSGPSAMAGIMATMLAANHMPSVSQLDIFEEELTKLIMDYDSPRLTLDCDYHPCTMLVNAADVAKIELCVFPWKVCTETRNDGVQVADGYGQPYVKIQASDFEK